MLEAPEPLRAGRGQRRDGGVPHSGAAVGGLAHLLVALKAVTRLDIPRRVPGRIIAVNLMLPMPSIHGRMPLIA